MKKITLRIITAILGILLFTSPALASTTASLTPSSVKVTSGQRFSVAVSVNPQGTANYAEKVEINYPADMLEVSSFTLGNNWMAMTQMGYDSTDNTNGILIKTAGYPGGISASTNFGTITFKAKKSGNGNIKIGNSSIAFQASSQSAISGNSVSFAITAPVIVPKVKVTPKETEPVAPTVTEQETETATTSAVQIIETPEVAAVTTAVPETTANSWIWIVSIIIGILIIFGIYKVVKR